jgi:phthiocerol/phenolphthiocerol synthesis type-I polyketide synthase C
MAGGQARARGDGRGSGDTDCMRAASADLGGVFPVAVIGVSCRFPGAGNPAEFWSLLRDGIDAVGPIPEDRWDVAATYHRDPAKPGKTYAREGGFIADIDKFDAAFFGISPREARRIDPQQRILLEMTWEAMEDAGIVPARLAGSSTGVFVGISFSDYAALQREDPEHVDAYVMSGSAVSNAANRISYIFDLHGPSFAVDTACSSSLVAVHEACVSLWRGESSLAIAAGVNALLSPSGFIGFSKAHMLSPNGRCRAFDAAGDGYVRSEGGAVVVLQPLAQALAEGNPIWAVIAGSGVNSDGRTTGLAMPNSAAQEALLRQVYRDAGIDPAGVTYVEAHGTGTSVGDPAECAALGHVFGAARSPGDPCRIGSVKTNIGHLEPASGVAGLLKVLLALRHRALPRSLHLVTPNPLIPFADLNLSVVSEHVELPPGPLVMAVNSFGFGGTNAHLVLREPDAVATQIVETRGQDVQALLVSAHDREALGSLALRYADLLRSPAGPSLAGVCRTAATKRTHHAHRLAVSGRSAAAVAEQLEAYAAGGSAPALVEGQAPITASRLAFVFSGNGSQWRGMGRDLLGDPFLAGWIERIDKALQPHLGWSVAEVLRSAEPDYDRTEVAQPALFAVQVAILEWLRAHGLEAEAMVGHSVGEVAAAYAAGILPLADACRVIAVRSQAQGRTAGAGRMAALGLSADAAAEAIQPFEERLTLAGINSPNSVTVAGDAGAIAALGEELKGSGAFFRELALDYAFHSQVMDPIREELLTRLDGLTLLRGHSRFVSSVAGAEIAANRLDATYWWDNIRKPVLFASAIDALAADGITVFLEIGPHPILDGYIRECLRASGSNGRTLATLRRQEPEHDALWLALGRCYAAAVAIDFDALYPEKTAVVQLPAYPWQRERYWFSETEEGFTEPTRQRKHQLLGKRLPTAAAIWKNRLDPLLISWLPDHVVQGSVVVPGAAFIEMALAAVSWVPGTGGVEIEHFEIYRPLVIAAGGEVAVEVRLSAEDGGFHLHAGESGGSAAPVAIARAVPLTAARATEPGTLAAIRKRMGPRIDGADLYRRFAAHGLAYGPAFRGIAEAWGGAGEALGRIVVPATIEPELGDYRIHPAILDACLQVTLAAMPGEIDGDLAALVPSKANRIRFYGGGQGHVSWCHMRLTHTSARSIVGCFTLLDENQNIIAEIDGMRFRRVEFGGVGEISAYHWRYQLRPAATTEESASDLIGPRELASWLMADGTADRRKDSGKVRAVLDHVAASYARAALAEVVDANGLFTAPGLRANGSPPPAEARAFARLFAHLESAGVVTRAGPAWRLTEGEWTSTPAELWRDALNRYPGHLRSLQLVARCGEGLPAALRRVADATSGAEPEPEGGILDQLYDAEPLFHGARDKVVRLLRELCRALPRTRLLRVLEIAGGSGLFTDALLAALPADRTEYVFTDPSEDVVARAGARFAGLTSLRCAALDLARSLDEQGFGATNDVIVASAAVVAASDLAAIAALLKPGGLFLAALPKAALFLELAATMDPTLLNAVEPDWRQALTDAGFDEVISLGDDDPATAGVVIAGRKPVGPSQPVVRESDPTVWLVLSAKRFAAPASILTQQLDNSDRQIILVDEGERFERLGLSRFAAPAGDRDSYARLLQLLAVDGIDRLHVVHMRGMSEIEPSDPLAQAASYDLLTLVQAIIAAGLGARTNLTVVTSGAMPAIEGPGNVSHPWQAPLWGVARTVMNERPDIACRLIDLDPELPPAAAVAALGDELLHPDDENEILLRGGGRYAPRLTRGLPQPTASETDGESGFTLAFGQGEAHDRAILSRIAIPRPAADEVSAQVRATGVNFRDVLQHIGLLPEEAFEEGFAGPTLGLEFSGEVIAVGEQVERLRPGDAVFGFGRSAFSSHLTTPAFCLFRKPAAMSFAEAATLPVAAVTVYYSLHHLAHLAKGERILIHGAAGGVGLAAVQYAKAIGAEIFASAGTAEKRALLRRLGVQHVVDSRTLAFADDIRDITGGEGVDVVLNSLAGEAIHKGISILRPYGRFIELGKRDFYANSKLGLSPFRNNIQFFGVDVDRLLIDRPVLAGQLFEELTPLFEQGTFYPLPHRVYPIARAAEAFRSMQQSRHIGKIVVTTTGAEDATPVEARSKARLQLSPDATYMVTGGRGGFGLATAEWLVGKGARHLALIGRRQTTAPDAAIALDRLRKDSIDVHEFSADITDPDQLAKVLSQVRRGMPPLRGVIHAAAVIQDVGIVNATRDNFHDVLRPKMAGAWNLHRQTVDERLDFFIMYSSATTLFGNEGQANYAAANLYLEALAGYRRSLGLPALTVAWGAIANVGHLARHAALTDRLKERLGVGLLTPGRALDRMAEAVATGADFIALAEVAWSRLARLPAVTKAPKYVRMRDLMSEEAGEVSGANAAEIRAHLAGLPRQEAIAAVQQLLIKHIAGVVGGAPAKIAVNRPLIDLGMDSLMLVELQIGLDKQFSIAIPTLELMDLATVEKLGRRIVDEIGSAPATGDDEPVAGDPNPIANEPEPAFELVLGRLIEQELDRAKERPL